MTLNEIKKILSAAGIDNANHESRILFSHFEKIPESDLVYLNPYSDNPQLIDAVRKRSFHYPLQYLLGYTYFYREKYRISPACLIPRQDTEILVDYAINHLPHGVRFADLCTGSGCVAISVLANRPDLAAIAVDISEDALALAEENSVLNNVSDRITFVKHDVMHGKLCLNVEYILSNPPYISREDMKNLPPELSFEPDIAFFGGEDGMDFYKKIVGDYPDVAIRGGFMFEIGYNQGEKTTSIAEKHGLNAEIVKDFSGKDRVAVLSLKNSIS